MFTFQQCPAINIPPWTQPEFNINMDVHTGPKSQLPVEELYRRSLRAIASFPNSVHIYTDGSVKGEKSGCSIFSSHYSECHRLPNHTSIFSAEAYAILRALSYGLEAKKDITVFTDSYSCLAAIKNVSEHPTIIRIQNFLFHSRLNITLCWVPSHCNIF